MKFDKSYYVNSKISNYKDYRKKKFSEQCEEIIKKLDLKEDARILDFGCATGGLVAEFKRRGFTNIKGTDISTWAIEFGRKQFGLEKELDYFNKNLLTEKWDLILVLDVLEHMPEYEIKDILKLMEDNPPKNFLVRIPIARKEGEDFVLEVSKNDKTHISCHCRSWWLRMMNRYGLKIHYDLQLNTIYSSEGVLAAVMK